MTTEVWTDQLAEIARNASLAVRAVTQVIVSEPVRDWRDYVPALAALDALLDASRFARNSIDGIAAPITPRDGEVVEGVGLVHRHGKSDTKEHDVAGLQAACAREIGRILSDEREVMVDAEGDTLPIREIVQRATARTVEMMIDATGMTKSKDWRVGGLARIGINVKEYKATSFGGWTVRIEPLVGTTAPVAVEEKT